ncbi:hypothetical protein NLI96_g9292 [Meripilus lineatus]|uniref:Uncharacterized protein n=1 Tax=Meripilus lineatus TaxID=2056292 RepID=A0AAD5UVP9_9APHY|nr:hypothetical protein NLI96_g9292 [Physisporinus lineatus]
MSPSTLPDSETLAKAYKVEVLDTSGKVVTFGELAYVSQLASVRDEALTKARKKLILIGCGDYQPIQHYGENTGFKGQIYANPSRELYQILRLTENLNLTPEGQEKKSYLANKTYWGNVFSSIWSGPVKHPGSIGKQGNISQLGGEFLFGPGRQCIYASRMEHTEDHVEVADLMKVAGVEYP